MRFYRGLALVAAMLAVVGPLAPSATAQVRTVDPNSAIDADLAPQQSAPPSNYTQAPPPSNEASVDPGPDTLPADSVAAPASTVPANSAPAGTAPSGTPDAATAAAATYKRDDVLSAAEGVFGKGAEGLASLVERVLSDQGEPNAYIAGREAGGALIIGVRYGSGVMTHRVEGERKVFWTGPSVGFDIGGDAAKVFVLAYNLYDSQEIYKRFPAVEGRLYAVGGFSATYLRSGNTVLIPIRLGVGWRAGVNVGYMNITEKSRILPF